MILVLLEKKAKKARSTLGYAGYKEKTGNIMHALANHRIYCSPESGL